MATGIAGTLLRTGLLVAFTAPTGVLASSTDSASAITIDTATMTPGSYVWNAPATAPGPVSIMVSLPDQRAYVYQGTLLVAVTTVSTGKEGHETPVGNFTVLQKNITHRSNKYNDAPMPYMQRLTWDGLAIHAGSVPGAPDSHGCVHVPLAFAKKLYALTRLGAKVEITDLPIGDNAAPADPVDPVDPVDPSVEQPAVGPSTVEAVAASEPNDVAIAAR